MSDNTTASDEPALTKEQWDNYQNGAEGVEKYAAKVDQNLIFLERTRLAINNAAMIACAWC